jgi:hypothetical protein
VAVHFLFGAAAFEMSALLLRGPPDGSAPIAGDAGPIAVLLLGGALLTGFAAPLIARPAPSAIGLTLAIHAVVAMAAVAAVAVWLTGL